LFSQSIAQYGGTSFPFVAYSDNVNPLSTPPRQQHHDPPAFVDKETRGAEDTGIYESEDKSLRAFVASSPISATAVRPRTAVDLVLPPTEAFFPAGKIYIYSLFLQTHSYLY